MSSDRLISGVLGRSRKGFGAELISVPDTAPTPVSLFSLPVLNWSSGRPGASLRLGGDVTGSRPELRFRGVTTGGGGFDLTRSGVLERLATVEACSFPIHRQSGHCRTPRVITVCHHVIRGGLIYSRFRLLSIVHAWCSLTGQRTVHWWSPSERVGRFHAVQSCRRC